MRVVFKSCGQFAQDVFRLADAKTDKQKALAFYDWFTRCMMRGPNLMAPDGAGGYRFVFVYPIRKGQELDLLVTRAESTAGISRMFDRNGELVLESDEEGDFHLKTPCLFAPGRNVQRTATGLAGIDQLNDVRVV